jgi:hypothetical protein
MAEESDLLPWVVGGVLIVSAALATGLAWTGASVSKSEPRAEPPAPIARQAATPISTQTSPVAAAPTAPAPASTEPSPEASAVAPATAARPLLPVGQVFECFANGQRIFSDAPCGAHSSIRQLAELNVMDSSPVAPLERHYHAPPYPQSPTDQNAPYYAPDYGANYGPDYGPDYANDLYSGPQVIMLRERPRRDHFPRHDSHPHGSPRKN